MTRDRGEHQGIYAAIYDGRDFRALDRDARWLLVTMRLTLGATGIAAVPAMLAVYAERTAMPSADVQAALDNLNRSGWVETEENVAWVIRALEFTTGLEQANHNHRRFVQRHVASLPRLAIVSRFCARYPEWIEGAVPSAPEGSGTHPEPIAITTTTTRTRTTTGGVDAGVREQLAYHVRCVVALNDGLRLNPDIGGRFHEVSGSEMAGTVSWEADGIPVELAERVVSSVASKYRPTQRNRQPSSLRYFDAAVRQAFELGQQPRRAAPMPAVAGLPRLSA